MTGKDGWRPSEKESELILHIPLRKRAHYRVKPRVEGSLGAVGEGWAS